MATFKEFTHTFRNEGDVNYNAFAANLLGKVCNFLGDGVESYESGFLLCEAFTEGEKGNHILHKGPEIEFTIYSVWKPPVNDESAGTHYFFMSSNSGAPLNITIGYGRRLKKSKIESLIEQSYEN